MKRLYIIEREFAGNGRGRTTTRLALAEPFYDAVADRWFFWAEVLPGEDPHGPFAVMIADGRLVCERETVDAARRQAKEHGAHVFAAVTCEVTIECKLPEWANDNGGDR